MTEKKMAKKIEEIEMPEDMRIRIIGKCYAELEKNKMSKRNVYNYLKKPVAAVAALALCLCVTSVTVLAATGKLQGFFKDVKRWDGAVIGTTYEQSTDEINVKIAEVTDELIVEISMVDPKVVPYSLFELFGLNNYKIVDINGKTIVETKDKTVAEVSEGKVMIQIPLNEVASGEYKLVINEMVGCSKADQPLVLHGTWECIFTK